MVCVGGTLPFVTEFHLPGLERFQNASELASSRYWDLDYVE